MAYFILALFIAVILLIGWSRRRIKANAALADAVTMTELPPPEPPIKFGQAQRDALAQYNQMVDDHNKLYRKWELINDKSSTQALALQRRLSEKRGAIEHYKASAPSKLRDSLTKSKN